MFQFVLQSRYYRRWHAGEHLDEFPNVFFHFFWLILELHIYK